MVKIDNEPVEFKENKSGSSLVFLYEDVLYTWVKAEDVMQAEKFIKEGNIELSKANWAEKMQSVILPLTKEYDVTFDKALVKEVKASSPDIKLMLQERGEYLLFQPVFTYNGFEAKGSDKETMVIP
jgi:hypothetical protein